MSINNLAAHVRHAYLHNGEMLRNWIKIILQDKIQHIIIQTPKSVSSSWKESRAETLNMTNFARTEL